MWQETQSDFLRSKIRGLLNSIPISAKLCSLVEEPLAKTSRGLDKNSQDHLFPLLPLIVCEAISGKCNQAVPAAAAIQFLTAAADVFDDIQDQDSTDSLQARYGIAISVNIATILFSIAWKAIADLAVKGVPDKITIEILKVISTYCVTASAGQSQDISLDSVLDISEETYLKISGMKSAAQIECACHVGALIGGGNEKLIDKFCKFGYNLGMAAQITNDVLGITQGGDLVKPKITLPVIYALSQTHGDTHLSLERVFIERKGITASSVKKTSDLLFQTGAVHYAMVKIEAYKQKAAEILSTLKAKNVDVEKLKVFLQ